jgi:hypothetical protein
LPDELSAIDVLARLREIGLSNLGFCMVRFSRPLTPALPSLYFAKRMLKVSFG